MIPGTGVEATARRLKRASDGTRYMFKILVLSLKKRLFRKKCGGIFEAWRRAPGKPALPGPCEMSRIRRQARIPTSTFLGQMPGQT
jgi:hypothetical protein